MAKTNQGHQARKRLGQNFLHDQGIIGRIVRAISPKADDALVEIGPGLGALTEPLLEASGGRLDVVELDRDLIPILRTKFFNFPDFTIHESDALKFDFSALAEEKTAGKIRIVGSLPYNISTPLIFHLLAAHNKVQDMHFMLQKEVVQRMTAEPGSSHYGRLGIMTQYYCEALSLFVVPPESFNPKPKVDSAIIRLVPYTELPTPAKSIKALEAVVRDAFNMRRKTLRNSLKKVLTGEEIEALEINPAARPETLSLEQFVRLADCVFEKQQAGETE